jgi:hypothetical protein
MLLKGFLPQPLLSCLVPLLVLSVPQIIKKIINGCFAIVTSFWYGLPIYSKQFEALNARDPNLSIAC